MAIALTDANRDALAAYLEEITRWGHRLNLSAIPAAAMWARHVEESLLLLGAADPDPHAALVDVGSGAGVPGIVVATVRPDLHVTLLEADTRKCGFLVHVAGLLGLGRVEVVTLRAEDAGHSAALRERFDVALSRAAAPPAALCELALPLVRAGGRLCALVGDAPEAIRACAAASAACGGAHPEAPLPGVLMVRKVETTPARLPRRAGVPTRRPLR